jgi:hypothetical protein
LTVKLAGRSALVQIAPSTQQMTAHAGLVLVRELAGALGFAELLDEVTVKKRRRGFSPAQQTLALCETLIAGGDVLMMPACCAPTARRRSCADTPYPIRPRWAVSSRASTSATCVSSTAPSTSYLRGCIRCSSGRR